MFTFLKYAWAFPATALGLVLAACAKLVGSRVRVKHGLVEVALRPGSSVPGTRHAWLPFCAITLGHVVIARREEDHDRCRAHERVHVAQYERWGPLFLVAYPAESLYQLLRGRRPYLDNRFEVAARACDRP
jgi:hypothetical protein